MPVEKLVTAAEWSYKPKASGQMPRAMHAYEKGIIWGNDNYLIQSALVDLVLATHNVGRRGTGVVRMGGHQEGYTRPPYPGNTKIYIDQELINGNGRMMTWWACNNFQTSNNAQQLREAVLRRSPIVKQAMQKARGASAPKMVDIIYDATQQGRALRRQHQPVSDQAARGRAPDAALDPSGRDEPDLDERRAAPAPVREVHGRRRERALPDCLIAATHRQHDEGDVREGRQRGDGDALLGLRLEDRGGCFQRRLPPRRPARRPPIDSQGGGTGNLATYERLRAAGNNGVQLPIKDCKDGKLVGTEMLYTDGKFDTADGKAEFKPSTWPGLPKPVAEQKAKYKFWINNGRSNEVWQTAYHDQYDEFVRGR